MPTTQSEQVLALAKAQGLIRARELDVLGIPRMVMARLVANGALVKSGRGLYMHPDANVTEHHSLVQVAARVPHAVVNLLSALAFHEMTDQLPASVWIAIRAGKQAPRMESPLLEVTRTAQRFLELGVEQHVLEGRTVAVTNPARTVVDCFKFRSRVGLDVAIAALRDFLRLHRGQQDELWRMADACRVQTVIRPYLETLT